MSRREGCNLGELTVVIGIIALLISSLLPALNKARTQALRTKCLSNIRQLGMGLSIYASENKDAVPIGPVATAVRTNGVITGIDPVSLQPTFAYFAYFS